MGVKRKAKRNKEKRNKTKQSEAKQNKTRKGKQTRASSQTRTTREIQTGRNLTICSQCFVAPIVSIIVLNDKLLEGEGELIMNCFPS